MSAAAHSPREALALIALALLVLLAGAAAALRAARHRNVSVREWWDSLR